MTLRHARRRARAARRGGPADGGGGDDGRGGAQDLSSTGHPLRVISGLPRAGSTLPTALLLLQSRAGRAGFVSPLGSLVAVHLGDVSQSNAMLEFIDDAQRARRSRGSTSFPAAGDGAFRVGGGGHRGPAPAL